MYRTITNVPSIYSVFFSTKCQHDEHGGGGGEIVNLETY